MLKGAIMNMLETNEKLDSLSKEIKRLSKETEDIKNQMELLKLKGTITKIKYSLHRQAHQQKRRDRGNNQWTQR